jgi:hypothetical protein
MRIVASSTNPANSCKQQLDNRRTMLEQARQSSLRRVKTDLERISKRESEYVKKLVETIVPVKVSWNQEAWDKIKEFVPVKVEPIVEEKSVQEKVDM